MAGEAGTALILLSSLPAAPKPQVETISPSCRAKLFLQTQPPKANSIQSLLPGRAVREYLFVLNFFTHRLQGTTTFGNYGIRGFGETHSLRTFFFTVLLLNLHGALFIVLDLPSYVFVPHVLASYLPIQLYVTFQKFIKFFHIVRVDTKTAARSTCRRLTSFVCKRDHLLIPMLKLHTN